MATRILERELAGAAAFARAQQLVRDAIGRASDPRIIELDRNMPWRETVVTQAPEALYVMYPKSDGWGMQAVPQELGTSQTAATSRPRGPACPATSWPPPPASPTPCSATRPASTSRPAAARASPSSPGARWRPRGNGSSTGVAPPG